MLPFLLLERIEVRGSFVYLVCLVYPCEKGLGYRDSGIGMEEDSVYTNNL